MIQAQSSLILLLHSFYPSGSPLWDSRPVWMCHDYYSHNQLFSTLMALTHTPQSFVVLTSSKTFNYVYFQQRIIVNPLFSIWSFTLFVYMPICRCPCLHYNGSKQSLIISFTTMQELVFHVIKSIGYIQLTSLYIKTSKSFAVA